MYADMCTMRIHELQAMSFSVISGGPLSHQYRLATIRFHWGESDVSGSEHLIDGSGFPLEVCPTRLLYSQASPPRRRFWSPGLPLRTITPFAFPKSGRVLYVVIKQNMYIWTRVYFSARSGNVFNSIVSCVLWAAHFRTRHTFVKDRHIIFRSRTVFFFQ